MNQSYYEADGTVVLEISGGEVAMSRSEAEDLFVMLGHTLQDMDVSDFTQGDDGEQPDV
jgi:hypothetical protein|tara:strand:- start:52 stop:228 length:177 start_codon:yes stop_codon:yes gene_type:complete